MKKVIFDIETKNIFSDVGSDNPADLDLSVISMYDYNTNKYYSFLENELNKLWPFLETADLFITFNGKSFDLPLLQKYAPFDLSTKQHLDIFEKVENSIKKKIGLNAIASMTLGISKSASGLQAVKWWNSGEIKKIIKYCEQDVKVTKDVYEYGLKNKKLSYFDTKTKEKTDIIIDFSLSKNQNNNEAPTLF